MCTALLLSAHPLSFVSHSEHILYAVDKDAHDQYDLFRLIHNLLPRINPFVFFIFPLLYTMHKLNRYVPIEEGCLKAAPAGGHYLNNILPIFRRPHLHNSAIFCWHFDTMLRYHFDVDMMLGCPDMNQAGRTRFASTAVTWSPECWRHWQYRRYYRGYIEDNIVDIFLLFIVISSKL